MMQHCKWTGWLAAAVIVLMGATVQAVQLQDITRLKGAETNTLIGQGLVVGLKGTGDGGKYLPAMEPLAALHRRLINETVLTAELKDAKNVAIVQVEARLPASGVREGDLVDVTVASIGPASSLKGGRLVITPMMGPVPGSPVYAFARGKVITEDEETPTVGSIRLGGQLARDIFANPVEFGRITLVLDHAYATWPVASLISRTINEELGFADGTPATLAQVTDPKNVIVQIPEVELNEPGSFISRVQEISIDSSLLRTPARVVINKSTGTIVITGDVRLSPVGISHGGLIVTTVRPPITPTVDSPQVRQEEFVALDPDRGATREGARLADLLAAFNHLKVPAPDRIAIIELIKRSGKLHAKIEYVE